ncbi:transient receptor potential cation channel subfamily a member 1-like [Gigaspora margarita]|uniref:Transient receptor potential cation channel subfamily a member 1-like n=1 Tax=Gigaspora margarita TaxID=4874 RepID=A0A8H3XF86_GIGMA|nr:transient receptor potential cation channel subfamily a member 1-like [Gigaspora margarita]
MTSNSDNTYVNISIEMDPNKNKNKKILEIVCSPKLEHIAALHANNDISLWSIVSQESNEELLTNVKTINLANIRRNEKIDAISDYNYDLIRKIFAISDNKQFSISLDIIDHYNFKIFDFEIEEEIKLTFPDWQKEIDLLSFIDNGNIIMINAKDYRAYVFSSKRKDNMKYVCKLFIFNDTIHEITMWDIDDLSVKTRILIEWSHILQHIEISDDEELLVVCTEDKKSTETNLYIFSTETGINLSSLNSKFAIDRILIENLVNDNWVEYLRKELKDTNSITTPSKMTIDLITKIIMEKNYFPPYNNNNEFEGKFLKWSLELNDESVKLIVNKLNTSIKMQLDILPSLKNINGKDYIVHCEVLENDDFITITRIGVFIWTYKLSNIKMHYYWNDWNNFLENFVFEKKKLRSITDYWTSGRILPASSYETVLKNLHVKFGEKELFEEFLISNIEDEFYLTCYGKDLMEILIILKDDKWIRYLGHSCFEKCLQENTRNHLISKISILSIIFDNFNELSENHPAFIANMLSFIGFVIPSTIVNTKSTSSHISKYGRYYQLYNTSYIDILSSILWDRFQESFRIKFQNFLNSHPLFRDLIVMPITNFYNTSLFILLNITIYLGIWHLIFELRQFIFSPLTYFSSSWNILDLAAIISTTATSIYWLKNGSTPTWAITFSALFLEIKFILFFRPNKFFGIYLAIIMKTVDKVISFLIIFGLFILVFAHTLHLLIGSESELSQDLNTNIFTHFGSAAIASYYMMITGDTTPISLWVSNENIMIMLLMLIVSFFLLIYLMNLFIGILSNLISNEDNHVAYLTLKSEIIEEIELFYMLPHQRRKETWFPFVIFYECHIIKLREHIMDILKDKWSGYKAPYISEALNKVLLLPDEQPSLKEIERRIKNQSHTLKKIEKKIEDLPVLKQDIKELKESIEDMKTNK